MVIIDSPDSAGSFWERGGTANSAGPYLQTPRLGNSCVNPVPNKWVGSIEFQVDRTCPFPLWKNRILFSSFVTLILLGFFLRCLSRRNNANLTMISIFFVKGMNDHYDIVGTVFANCDPSILIRSVPFEMNFGTNEQI
jgi:hypothetical protein